MWKAGALVNVIRESTDDVRPKDGFDFWREKATPLVNAHRPASGVPFSASRAMAAVTLGIFVDTRSDALGIEQTAKQIRRQDSGEIAISMVVSGDCYQQQGDTSVEVRQGGIAIVDMNSPYAIGSSSAYRELRVHLPRDIFTAQIGRIETLAGRNYAAGGALHGLFASYFQQFADVLPAMSATEADRGFEGLLFLLQSAMAVRAPVAKNQVEPAALRSLAETYIGRHLHDPDLDPSRIAAALSISRTRLYEAFAETDGVAATILAARLDAAQRMLVLPEGAAIGAVLLDCGFRDAPTFNRAFRRRFGMTPTELRTMGQGR
jgi:AraC-like DNA-binding protein